MSEYTLNSLEWNCLFPVLLLFIFCKGLHLKYLFASSAFAQVPLMPNRFLMSLTIFNQDIGFVRLFFVLFCTPRIASSFSDQGVNSLTAYICSGTMYPLFTYHKASSTWELTWPSPVRLSALTEECIDSWMYFLVDNNNIFHTQANLAEDFHIFSCFL